MAVHELAGKPGPKSLLANIPRLVTAYYTKHPDAERDTEWTVPAAHRPVRS